MALLRVGWIFFSSFFSMGEDSPTASPRIRSTLCGGGAIPATGSFQVLTSCHSINTVKTGSFDSTNVVSPPSLTPFSSFASMRLVCVTSLAKPAGSRFCTRHTSPSQSLIHQRHLGRAASRNPARIPRGYRLTPSVYLDTVRTVLLSAPAFVYQSPSPSPEIQG